LIDCYPEMVMEGMVGISGSTTRSHLLSPSGPWLEAQSVANVMNIMGVVVCLYSGHGTYDNLRKAYWSP